MTTTKETAMPKPTSAERAVADAEAKIDTARTRAADIRHQRRVCQAELATANEKLSRALKQAGMTGTAVDVTPIRGEISQLQRLDYELGEMLTGAEDAVNDAEAELLQVRIAWLPQLADRLEKRSDELLTARRALAEQHEREQNEQASAERELLDAWQHLTTLAGAAGWSNGASLHGYLGRVDPELLRPAVRPDRPSPNLAQLTANPNWPQWLQDAHRVAQAQAEQAKQRQRQGVAQRGGSFAPLGPKHDPRGAAA